MENRIMKPSGNKLIGDIPLDWTRTKIKYVAQVKGRIGFRGYTQQDLVDENEGAITLSPSNIQNMKMNYDRCSYISWFKYDESPEIKIHNGDILFVKTGSSYSKSGFVENLPQEATINPQLVVFKDIKINNKYLFYFLQTQPIKVFSELAVVGGVIPTMSQEVISNFSIVAPPIQEQQVIVEFLDSKCSEIDGLVADIQSQIDTLEQYKCSVITETVTKGLNPDAAMKDSGIEWVGEVPEHWNCVRGKYLFTLRAEKGNRIELQLLSPTQKFGVIPQTLYEELSGMTTVKLNENIDLAGMKTIHKGDYCISLRSFQGGFEYSEYEGVVSPAYQVFYPTVEIADGYYKYLFKETGFIGKMNSYTMSLRDGKNIAFADFGRSLIPYPPVDEQQAIAAFLDSKCSEIDGMIAEKKIQMETLDQYKKSLIFEYVTGKKQVKGEA